MIGLRTIAMFRFSRAQRVSALAKESSWSLGGRCISVSSSSRVNKNAFKVQSHRWKSSSSSNDLQMKTQLRDELAGVMNKQKPQPPPKPKVGGFVHFLKVNKTQFLNIGASFFCVLLAYQIVALRRSGRYRQQQLDERKQEVAEKQALLRSLTNDEFVNRMAQECAAMVLLEEDANKRKWAIGSRQMSPEELAEKLRPVIDLLLNEQIGDEGLTEEQKKEKTVVALRNAQVSQTEIDVEEAIAIVQDSESGKKVVQKRVFQM